MAASRLVNIRISFAEEAYFIFLFPPVLKTTIKELRIGIRDDGYVSCLISWDGEMFSGICMESLRHTRLGNIAHD